MACLFEPATSCFDVIDVHAFLFDDVSLSFLNVWNKIYILSGLTEEEVIEEVLTIGGAGHETTANTLSWAMYLLGLNPDTQASFLQEIEAKVVGAVPTFEEAKKLDYARSILYETLRLYVD